MSVELTELNLNSSEDVLSITRLYISVPQEWDPKYKVTDEMLHQNYQWILQNKDNLKCFVLKDDHGFVGLHLLFFESEEQVCHIKTLWIDPSLRGQGWGSRLKDQGEKWAREKGAKKIATHVMAHNSKMLQMNKKYGFLPVRIEMHKELE